MPKGFRGAQCRLKISIFKETSGLCLFKISEMFNFSKDFRGAQCQFPATACNPTKLGFNGGYNCSGSGRWLSLNPISSNDGFYDTFFSSNGSTQCLIPSWHMDCFTRSVKRQVLSQASKMIIVLIPTLPFRATSSPFTGLKYKEVKRCANRSSTFSCHLKCPAPASFSYSPAPIYTCKYSEGVFRPAQVLRMGILKWAKDNHCPTMVMVMVILIGTMRKSNCCKKKKKKKKIVVLTLQKVSPRQRE